MNKDTLGPCLFRWMENVNFFQIAKIFQFFFHFQPGVAFKSVASKKGVYLLSSFKDCPSQFSQQEI